MRILLVNPPFSGIYYKLGFIFPPLGLAYLAAVLRTEGYDVEIVDLAVSPDGLNILAQKKFDLVGISGDTCRHPAAIAVAREVKKKGIKTVLGGSHASYLDQDILENNPYFDFVIRREGEFTLQELVQKLREEQELESIAGLSFRSRQGNFVRNPDRPLISDLDKLPLPARDLLPMEKYKSLELRRRKITPIVTSRGCPFQCPFCCSSHYWGTKWRTHSVERVLTEIELVTAEYGYRAVAFIDDTFTINMKRVDQLSQNIIDKKIDIRWWCFSRPDMIISNEQIIARMAASGARYVFMGVESGEEMILQKLKKGVDRSKSIQAIDLLRQYGIETMASYMFGDLEETYESILRTITFARALPTGSAQFSILTPFPGTVLWEQLAPLLDHRNWQYYDCTHLVFKHPHLTAEQLQKLHILAYRRYYLTLSRILTGALSFIRGKGVKLSKILPVLRKMEQRNND
ncbi:B12-binding domain-containing radical SAM protein [candidate division CSSED10-310 bacterium]|uniref:B12-binding domain-containing radical SAM protein n=1 Tax=candidate division CSSED10-310 bacterium TaxID=2855610 RepID=A0ABV6YW12_UNCC1